jgi:hypothetical protein
VRFDFRLFSLDNNAIRKKFLIKDYQKNQPNKWAIGGIIIAIIFSAIVVVSLCVVLRVCRLGLKHKTTNS